MQPLRLSSPGSDYAVLTASTDPASVVPLLEANRWCSSFDGEWRWPLRLQFEEPLPVRLLEAVRAALERFPETELYAYGDADPTLDWVGAVPTVQSLSISLYDVSSFDPLRRLSKLQRLVVTGTESRQSSLAFLEDLPQLEELRIEAQVKRFEVVAALTRLRLLDLYAVGIKSIEALRDHPALEVLSVSFGALRDFSPLASISTLRGLQLWQLRMMTDADLATVEQCQHLEAVSLGAMRNLEHLRPLVIGSSRSLRYVMLEGLRSLSSYRDFAHLPALRELSTDSSPAGDGRLDPFMDHPSLRNLLLGDRFDTGEVERLQHRFRGDLLYATGQRLIDRGGTRARVGWRARVSDVLRIRTAGRRYTGTGSS